MPARSGAAKLREEVARAVHRLLEFGPPAFAGPAHRAGIVNQQHDGDIALLAVAEPNRPRQRQQQEQNQQGAQKQNEPFAQAAARVELGVQAVEKHQRRKRARLLFQAEEEMKQRPAAPPAAAAKGKTD